MVNSKKLYIPLFGMIFLLSLALVVSILSSPTPTISQGIGYHGSVQVKHIRDGEILMDERNSNLLYSRGKNMTRDALLGRGNFSALNISICNASTPAPLGCGTPLVGSNEVWTNLSACGLGGIIGTYRAGPGMLDDGNYTITATFTNTCPAEIIINTTRLTNITGGMFAANTFTAATMTQNDQLVINWTCHVT